MSRIRQNTIGTLLLLSAFVPAMASAHIHRGPTAHRVDQHKTRRSSKSAPRVMEPARATEIQSALIRKGYLSGSPSGVWDSSTDLAMQKYQADNGWQTKLTPDSRAIIKLGLGAGPGTDTGAGPGGESVPAADANMGSGVPPSARVSSRSTPPEISR